MDPNTPYTSDQYLGDTNQKGFFERLSGYLVEFIETLVVFGAIFASIYLFVAQPNEVKGNSMLPNFVNAEYLLTDKLTYQFSEPKRGDVIVFKYPENPQEFFLKRIIGLPDEEILCDVKTCTIYIGTGESYIDPLIKLSDLITVPQSGEFCDNLHAFLGKDEYFVLGDNWRDSEDSRNFGPVPKKMIVGRIFYIYKPKPPAR